MNLPYSSLTMHCPRSPAGAPSAYEHNRVADPRKKSDFGRSAEQTCAADPLRTDVIEIPDAALGASLDVPMLDGPVTVKIPPGTQPGAMVARLLFSKYEERRKYAGSENTRPDGRRFPQLPRAAGK
jgi:hypothetical protein